MNIFLAVRIQLLPASNLLLRIIWPPIWHIIVSSLGKALTFIIARYTTSWKHYLYYR